ncbi:hypothetical protein SAMN04488074_13358 [Lentzea albidocapillata subsp. violacea]|uniref:Uncharacterized protein n=1 Tax=Lentzea albidocapillata subsp. violacea TaxID=128104 RepID=A0A1G9YIA8_9PSEU|nr:hypothetical protein SAMN04488074_13358 [Lentzea albidocapillata subsp. violacea]
MSWPHSAAAGSPGAPTTTRTSPHFSTPACQARRTSETSAPSTGPLCPLWTSSPPGSRVRTSPPPAAAPVSRRGNAVDCGPASWPPFAYYIHNSLSWRTWPHCDGATADSTAYSRTWPPQGMTHSGVASAPPTSERRTAAREFSCSGGPAVSKTRTFATPTAHDGSSNGVSAASRQGGPSLLDQLRLLPTPTALDRRATARQAQTNTGAPDHAASAGSHPPLSQEALPPVGAQTLLTPRASDGAKGCPQQRGSKGELMLSSAAVRLHRQQPRTTTRGTRRPPKSTGATTPPRSPAGKPHSAARRHSPPNPDATDDQSSRPHSSNT